MTLRQRGMALPCGSNASNPDVQDPPPPPSAPPPPPPSRLPYFPTSLRLSAIRHHAALFPSSFLSFPTASLVAFASHATRFLLSPFADAPPLPLCSLPSAAMFWLGEFGSLLGVLCAGYASG